METSFWQERWQKNEIGFHLPQVHAWLKRQWPLLIEQGKVTTNSRIFVPLCGKSLDIGYFLDMGHKVVACELSIEAVTELFKQLQLQPSITPWGEGQCYQAQNLCVYVGDFFTLTTQDIGNVECIYDRAALIALPPEMRSDYSAKLIQLCPKANMLLITLDYVQSLMSGPPFAVSEQEVQKHYKTKHHVSVLVQKDIIEKEPRFKKRGLNSLTETLYWLAPNQI